MAEIRRNKFSYDRNYYENMKKIPVEGTAARAYDEDVEDFPDEYTEEYTEADFEGTSPKKRRVEVHPARRPRTQVKPQAEVKLKKRYSFDLVLVTALLAMIVFLVGSCYRYIALREEVIQASKKIVAAKTELEDVNNLNSAFMKRLDVETDRNYIYSVAVSKLNMIYPKENNTVYYERPDEGYVRQYKAIPASN